MNRPRLPGGLRLRLALAISAIAVAIVGATFIALHAGVGTDLRGRIDRDLREQYREFELTALGSHPRTPADLEKAARRFVSSQRYHAVSRIFLVDVAGAPRLTNESGVIDREAAAEGGAGRGGEGQGAEGPGLLGAPAGLATVSSPEAGHLRVYSHPIVVGGRRLGTFRVADPLSAVSEAQSGLSHTFVLVGVLAVAAAVITAVWVASLITRPVRRMARVASDVGAGDLSRRIDYSGRDEVGVLAAAFNGMLDRLEEAFRRQRGFVSDASHELRSPLTVLRGQIELLTRGGDSDERSRAKEVLLREIDRMNRLIDDMLTLAGAESGELVQRRPVELADFLADLERDLPLLGRRDYHVEDAPGGTLGSDPDRLAQVFRNLVRNAVAHTDPGGRITIAARPEGGWIAFSVTDTGTGIEPEHLERLFDRFYRTDAGRARDQGGSGLGLAIARAIVEAHGGRIWAESEPGHGTTIQFELPGYTPPREVAHGAARS